jgi:hypothetical protein
MPPMRNKFAKQLPPEQERKRRLYLLDTDPLHSLQVFNVPQYLPKDIHGYNTFTSAQLYDHHERVKTLIAEGNITFGFDEDGVEKSLAFIFGVDLPPSKKAGAKQKKIRVLQLYFEAPDVEDVPPGVFGQSGVAGPSQWSAVPPATSSEASTSSTFFQHSGRGAAGGSPGPAGKEGTPSDDEDGPTRGGTPEDPSPLKGRKKKKQ